MRKSKKIRKIKITGLNRHEKKIFMSMFRYFTHK